MSRREPARGGRRGARGSGRSRVETLQVDSIAAGGEGVGRLADGRVTFVHRTAPGDRVEVELVERRDRWARGRLLRVLEPGPDRREAPCPFYQRCGGCTLEHLTYPAQLRAKARIVEDALTRIGRLEVTAPEVVPSPREHRYRNRVSFALRRLGGGRVAAGFHAVNAPDEIVDLDGGCLLFEEPIAVAWEALRASWGPDARLLPSGEQLRLTLRATTGGDVSLLVEGGFSPGRPHELLERVPALRSVWHRPGAGASELIAGAPGLPETWGDESLDLSGTAFLQVNREAAALLEDHVMALAGHTAGLRVVDAYCGVGLHARRLSRAGAVVVGIELDAAAVRAAREADIPGARFEEGPVEALLHAALPADLLILNPPRAGVAPEVLEAVRAQPPARLIYVSCNPATLARDLRAVADLFEIRSLRSFDLFPQTAHVETVVLLERAITAGTPGTQPLDAG